MAGSKSGSFDPDQCSSMRFQHVAPTAPGRRESGCRALARCACSASCASRTLRNADLVAVSVRASLCRRADGARSQYPRLADRRADGSFDLPCASNHRAGRMKSHPAGTRPDPILPLVRELGREGEAAELVLELDGYEGPIDLLLALAREQKVDLAKISILALADQYLDFIARQRLLRLEIAADYLVMAAWLAYLKSRLLLPQPPEGDEPSGAELAAVLEHRLRLLAAMQTAGSRLMSHPRLGHDVFPRGMPEGLAAVTVPVYELGLFELLQAYGENRRRAVEGVLAIEPSAFHSVEEALTRLRPVLGHLP